MQSHAFSTDLEKAWLRLRVERACALLTGGDINTLDFTTIFACADHYRFWLPALFFQLKFLKASSEADLQYVFSQSSGHGPY